MDGWSEARLAVLARQLESPQGAALDPLSADAAAAGAPAVVIGGLVMDVQARPSVGGVDVQRGGSVPGAVMHTPGGVARNIAVALALRTRLPPLLVSCAGRDPAGDTLIADLVSRGLPTRGVLRGEAGATAAVSVIFDAGGEVAASVADVTALERELGAPGALLPRFSADIAAAPLLVLDANLSQGTLEAACRAAAAAGVPVWFEPVSAPKSTRAAPVLGLLSYVSPNAAELVAMAAAARKAQGRPFLPPPPLPSAAAAEPETAAAPQTVDAQAASLHDSSAPQQGSEQHEPQQQSGDQRQAARLLLARLAPHMAVLLQAGVRHVILTLGAAGAALATLDRNSGGSSMGSAGGSMDRGVGGDSTGAAEEMTLCITCLPAAAAAVANTSGAGDCLVAGAAAALLRRLPAAASLAHGMAAAHAAVESAENVPAGCDAAAEAQRAKQALAGRRCWVEAVKLP